MCMHIEALDFLHERLNGVVLTINEHYMSGPMTYNVPLDDSCRTSFSHNQH